jgi:hypothetical protein
MTQPSFAFLRSALSIITEERNQKKTSHGPIKLILQQGVSFLGACWLHRLYYPTQQKENEP